MQDRYDYGKISKDFLAPTGAQGVTIFVCSSVRLSGPSLSEALNLHLLAKTHFKSTQRALGKHSERLNTSSCSC